jgi:alkylated DNA repair dioxygenase AlkB
VGGSAYGGLVALAWQESLFGGWILDGGRSEISPRQDHAADLGFDDVHRLYLDQWSWLDLVPGWLPDHAEVFERLLADAPWQQRERTMYDARVLEPRLVAGWTADDLAGLPTRVAEIRRAVGARYAADFDSVLVNLYRDGRDGVAWHGDRVRLRLEQTVVVTVALGERRRFRLRRGASGPTALTLISGEGDLIVMGGRCQHDWQHTVPKATRAGARMSITMRHSLPLP